MAIIQGNAKKSTAAGGFYPKTIEGSLRFNDDDSAYLSWTAGTPTNRKKFTFSCWVKRGLVNTTAEKGLFSAGTDNSNHTNFGFGTDTDTLQFQHRPGDASGGHVFYRSTAKYSDPSAWYHIVLAIDTTQGTASNRIKLYVNGVQDTTFVLQSGKDEIQSNEEFQINESGKLHTLGARKIASIDSFNDGYMAEVHFIDGQALDEEDFGELKNGVWVAKNYAGTYGANGFYLNFQDDTEVEAFNTTLYRGNGTGQSVTGMGFSPDMIWIKERTSTSSHRIHDTVRGPQARVFPDNTNAESSSSTSVSSFDSDGFSVLTDGGVNENNQTYVAWGWKAGGSSNTYNVDGTGYASMAAAGLTDGTAVLTGLSVSTTYGFSISTFNSGSSGTQSFAHGLGTTPSLCIFKERNQGGVSDHWVVWEGMTGNPETSYGYLNLTNAFGTDILQWSETAPTSTTFTFNSGYAWSTSQDMIAYCWADTSGNAEGQRYSKFGSYTGSRTAGQTVNCGFRPAFLLVKNINQSGSQGNWMIVDGTRETTNSRGTNILYPNDTVTESTIGSDDLFDFTATGFDVLNTGDGTAITAQMNGEGDTIIYAAFADTREAAFWLDQSGNDNDWQPVNLDHNDTLLDSPTDNFCTWNPLNLGGGALSDGNLRFVASNSLGLLCTATMAFDVESTTNKYYWEVTVSSGEMVIGIAPTTLRGSDTGRAGSYGYYGNPGSKFSGTSSSSYGANFGSGDVIGVAVGDGKITFYKNGVSQGDAFTGLTGIFVPFIAEVTCDITANFGQQPFKYDPPA